MMKYIDKGMMMFARLFVVLMLLGSAQFVSAQDNVDNPKREPSDTSAYNYSLAIEQSILRSMNQFLEKEPNYLLPHGMDKRIDTTWTVCILLKSGTCWELHNPPKKPALFVSNLVLMKKKKMSPESQAYFDFARFEEAADYKKQIPWELVDNIVLSGKLLTRADKKSIDASLEFKPNSKGGLEFKHVDIKEVVTP